MLCPFFVVFHYISKIIVIDFFVARYYTPRPTFEFKYFDQLCECRIKLPPSAAVQMVVGSTSRSRTLAKQLACLEACKKLHEVGALNDNLIPSIKDPAVTSVSVSKSKDTLAGAGIIKALCFFFGC